MSAAALPAALPPTLVEDATRAALAEDLGRAGDVTTAATIAPGATARATISSRETGVLAGMDFAETAFALQRAGLTVESLAGDGDGLAPGAIALRISGEARAILMAERVALNYLCHLSGIATLTATYVAAIEGTRARICDTRKTTPGLRAAEKYAVRCGGGANHRFGLDDAILIKDNHIAVCGGVAQAIARARAYAGHLLAIEIEVDRLDQLDEALSAGADAILLDNMDPATLREAVTRNAGRARLEASGGIDLSTVRAVAETGVDFISTSKITMSAPTLDLGLDIEMAGL